MPVTTRAQIDAFLSHKRLAMVGVSHNPQDISRQLLREFRRRQYDAIPVNPTVSEVDGLPCYASVGDIVPPVEAVLVMTPPAVTNQVVRDCDAAGIRSVWMFRGGGTGAVSPAALNFCEARGISVVAGECPFMFLPGTEWFHRCHAFFRRLFGQYPS
jgi:uncharacterized protein